MDAKRPTRTATAPRRAVTAEHTDDTVSLMTPYDTFIKPFREAVTTREQTALAIPRPASAAQAASWRQIGEAWGDADRYQHAVEAALSGSDDAIAILERMRRSYRDAAKSDLAAGRALPHAVWGPFATETWVKKAPAHLKLKPPVVHHACPSHPYGSEPLRIPAIQPLPVGCSMRVRDSEVTVSDEDMVVGRLIPATDAPPGTWSVRSIFVVPVYRRSGIASTMVAAYAARCRKPLVYPNDVTDLGETFFGTMLSASVSGLCPPAECPSS